VDKAKSFIVSIGHEPRVAQGVVDALKGSGLSGGALLSTVRSMAGRWEVGEDAGLEALVMSVKQELDRTEGKAAVTFYCIPPNAWASRETDFDQEKGLLVEEDPGALKDAAFRVSGLEGMSITDVAKFGEGDGASVLGEYLECACSGVMACSTCQVVVDDEWFGKVGEPEEAEQDMLDLAFSPRPTSRLGCQVVLSPELDGLVLRIPRASNNMMDHIPFDD